MHRFSVEWSRVEPEPGRFDGAALEHYAAVAAECRRLAMEPMVTLHHFTLPLWLPERGGVRAAEAPERFAGYATACARALGEVGWWITINEPAVLATLGHLYGTWPPGVRSLPAAVAALRGLLRMHAAAATALRALAAEQGRQLRISVAHHVRGFVPASRSPLDRAAAAVPDRWLNRWWLLACRDGRMRPPAGAWEQVPGAAGSLDWIGLNYYADELVRFDLRRPRALFAHGYPDPDRPRSTFDWAIDPDGLRRAIHLVHDLTGLPVVITENGVADNDDELRPGFLVDHLEAVLAALAEGADVRGYLHWTGMDNFEWAEGYGQRFGLWAVDRATLERRPKPSAEVFARICRAGGIPGDLRRGPGPADVAV